MPTVEFVDRQPALKYIKKNGYVSYSSLCLYKNGEAPQKWNPAWGIFGSELHSRFLENKKLKNLSEDEERVLKGMLEALRKHSIVNAIMKDVKVEQKFHQELWGLMVLGYIDIQHPKKHLADLKSTSIGSKSGFIEAMDFLQPTLYLETNKRKDFYYIGCLKREPFTVTVFNVNEYPSRLKDSQQQLKKLMTSLKKDLSKMK